MTGIFDTPKWNVGASGEMLNRKMFEHDSRKLSKIKEKRRKKIILSKSNAPSCLSQNSNKIFPHSGQEQFQTSNTLLGNIKGKVKHKKFGLSTLTGKRNKYVIQNEVGSTEQHSGKRKKKRKKKRKAGSDENMHVQLSSSNLPKNQIESLKKQLSLPLHTTKKSRKHSLSNEGRVVSDTYNNSRPDNVLKHSYHPLQNGSQIIHANTGKKPKKTKDLNSLKRRVSAISAEAGCDEVPAKKQIIDKPEHSDSRRQIIKQKKRKFKRFMIEPFNDEVNMQVDSLQKVKSKGFSQKNSKGRGNEAFSADSNTLEEVFNSGSQVPRDVKIKRSLQKQNSKGIINEAFSADSSVQDDSFNYNNEVSKHSEVKELKQKQNSKRIVTKVTQSESSPLDDSIRVTHKMPEQVKTPPWHILDKLQNGQLLSRKKLSCVPLRERMIARLKASRFRYLNEQMYSSDSSDIRKYFSNDTNSFLAYHEGFSHQVSQWPVNPLDRIINSLKKKPETWVIADFGCGDARLARSLPNVVHSFDVVALSKEVTVCDMSRTPLKNGSVDVAVFCLSLMGTNLADYLLEANRVLKVSGQLKIAEVESRFEDVNKFVHGLKKFGFTNTAKDFSHDMFYFLDFRKEKKPVKRDTLPPVTLKPCLYKKR